MVRCSVTNIELFLAQHDDLSALERTILNDIKADIEALEAALPEEPMFVSRHFHQKPMPLASVLSALAGQEGNDGDEGNAMQAAGDFIRNICERKAEKNG